MSSFTFNLLDKNDVCLNLAPCRCHEVNFSFNRALIVVVVKWGTKFIAPYTYKAV